jgi:hypothetical protein
MGYADSQKGTGRWARFPWPYASCQSPQQRNSGLRVNPSIRLYSEDITIRRQWTSNSWILIGMLFALPLDRTIERTEIDAPIVPHVLDRTQLH